MAETINRGPNIVLGPLIGNVQTQAGLPVAAVEPTDGPSVTYQGEVLPDIRAYPANKDGMGMGRLPSFLNSPFAILVDALPSASSATPADIAALQATTSGTPMTLATTQTSVAASGQCQHMPSVPIVPYNSTTPVSVFGLDMGFGYGTTVAGSGTVTVVDSTIYTLGQWIVIGGAGNSGTTAPLLTQVTNPSASATTITVSPVPQGAVTRAPIASGNAYIGFPANVTATAAQPYSLGGVARVFNPLEGVARCVGINAAAGAAGGTFTVKGYDIYGYPMSEAITVGAGAAVKYGNKCFKYIVSVTPNVTDASAHYSVGVGDTIGINLRSDKWEYLVVFVNQAFLTTATGYTLALQPPSGPSTTTTTDVRGSIQVGSRGNNTGVGGSGATGGPFSGTVRVAVQLSIPLYNLLAATPNNSAPLYGLAQV